MKSFVADQKAENNSNKTPNSSFHFVLDIQDTLGTLVFGKMEDLKKDKHYEWFTQRNLVVDAYAPHILHPGAVEFVKWLITKIPNSSLSFMSSGEDKRNKPFVAEIIKKAFPENFADRLKNVAIYSAQHLVANNGIQQPGEFFGNMKKDLKLVLKNGETLNNIVLIDDDPSYVQHGQEKNLLYFHSNSKFKQYKEDGYVMDEDGFFEANHIFYTVGLLKDALSKTKGSLADTLFELQYESLGVDAVKYKPINKQYYLDGLEELKKINTDPDFNFYGNKVSIDYIFQLPGKDFYNSIESLSSHVKASNYKKIQEIIHIQKAKSGGFIYDAIIHDALRDAIQLRCSSIVKLFIAEGVSCSAWAHAKGNSGFIESLISFVAKSGDLEMVKLFVENGAEIRPRNDYYNEGDDSAIKAAVKGGFADIVTYLLEKGAEVDGTIGRDRYIDEVCPMTYLGRSALNGNIAVVDALVKHGANVKHALELNYLRLYDLIKVNKKINDHRGYRESFVKKMSDQKEKSVKGQLPSTRILMDYALGVDFSENADGADHQNAKDDMSFFKDIDVSGINFIGVSLDGKPITHEVLKCKGIHGAEKAITTLEELKHSLADTKEVEDKKRLQILSDRLGVAFNKFGKSIDAAGHVNFVSLKKAAEIGDISVVKTRLAAGLDPNKDKAIVIAAKMGHLDIVKLLASDVKFDKTLLPDVIEIAKSNGQKAISDYINTMQDVNQPDQKGNTLLHRAVTDANIDEVKALIARGANVNATNKSGATPLWIAASKSFDNHSFGKESKNHIDMIEWFLKNGADANISCYGYSPLYEATQAGSSKAVQMLLPKTIKSPTPIIEPFSQNKIIGYKPWYHELMFKAIHSPERVAILTALKAQGANFSEKECDESGNTLLHYAMRSFPSGGSIASTMRDLRLSILGAEDRYPVSQLSVEQQRLIKRATAGFKKHLAYVDFLLQNGADPRSLNNREGKTPLHTFLENIDLDYIEGGYGMVIDLCLKKGFDINTQDNDGRTLIHIAASHGGIEAVKCLLARGANIDALDNDLKTPLHLAAAGNPETTNLLISRGAKSDVLDSKGRSAYDFSVVTLAQDESRHHFTKPEYKDEFREPYLRAQRLLMRNKIRQERTSLYGSFFANSHVSLPNACVEIIGEYAGFSVA